jgi:hypothetical protein
MRIRGQVFNKSAVSAAGARRGQHACAQVVGAGAVGANAHRGPRDGLKIEFALTESFVTK